MTDEATPAEVSVGSPPARPPDVRVALLDAARRELDDHGATGVSLRAVARRAGVSHAAPKHHFGDRAGLLTALAVDGHGRLTARLRQAAVVDDPGARIGALARAYLAFGFDEPALFELMFRADQVHQNAPDLAAAAHGSFGVLLDAIEAGAHDPGAHDPGAHDPGGAPSRDLALIAWAVVHGLVVLVRDGALRGAPGSPSVDPRHVAFALTDTVTALLSGAPPATPHAGPSPRMADRHGEVATNPAE